MPEAKAKARLLAGQVQSIFKWLRTGNIEQMHFPDSQINELRKRFLRKQIEDYDKPKAQKEYANDYEVATEVTVHGLDPQWKSVNSRRGFEITI